MLLVTDGFVWSDKLVIHRSQRPRDAFIGAELLKPKYELDGLLPVLLGRHLGER
jgi:hypothetical protein